MKIIGYDDIVKCSVGYQECYNWVDYVCKHFSEFIQPQKTRVALQDNNYFNVMPCVLPKENVMGIKAVTRNSNRHDNGSLNLDAQIFLYSYDTEELLAIMDGNWITTIRTATIAVHSLMNICPNLGKIAMVGLGNIGTAIGDILFALNSTKMLDVKVYNYKDQAKKFISRYKNNPNINFELCDDYHTLMSGSDIIFSSVNYIESDFCDESVYKPGCVIFPVHMRGFMGCDKTFDHIISSDLESIKKFKFYSEFSKLSLLNDVIAGTVLAKSAETERIIIYNLGIGAYDIYFANQIYKRLMDTGIDYQIAPKTNKYI